MSHGNTNKIFANSIDEKVKQLNKKIGRMLGKKDNQRPNFKTTNFVFSLVVFVVTMLVWLSTSIYYVPDGYNALLIKNGNVVKQVTGVKFSFFYPFPFGQMELFSATASPMIDLTSLNKSKFYNKQKESTVLDVKFSYLIKDPKLSFDKVTQNQDNLNDFVTNYVASNITNALYNESNLSAINYTIFANKVRYVINQELLSYGIFVVKLNLYKGETIILQQSNTNVVSMNSSLADQIIMEANNYRKNTLINTKADIEKYNTLHQAYINNPDAVIEEMYYDTLMSIPESKVSDYKLLDMPLSEFLKQSDVIVNPLASTLDRGRNLDRNFTRERHLNGAR